MVNSDYLKNLNKAQKEAVLYLDGPLLIVAGYILAIKVLPFTPLVSDSSLQERLKIVTYAKEIWTHFSLLPIHIDALSDFSTSFIVPNGYLDDFHNVFLQILFWQTKSIELRPKYKVPC